MTWPTGSVVTTDLDATTDSPANARDDILSAVQKLNQIIDHGEPVLLSATQTVAGTKTFSSSPVVPTPSADNHAVRKDYVDTEVAGAKSYADTLATDFASGGFRNLTLSATGSSATVSVSADALMLLNGSGKAKLVTPSLSINSAASGANGLDTGTLAANAWYSVWVIWNGTTVAGLLSASATSPTMPAGYTYKARVGWIRTDGTGNKWPLGFIQRGRVIQYVVAGALSQYPQMFLGATSGVQSVSVVNFCPPTAHRIALSWGVVGAGSGGAVGIGPTSVTTAWVAGGFAFLGSASASFTGTSNASMGLESTSIFVKSDNGNGYIGCTGWEDNL